MKSGQGSSVANIVCARSFVLVLQCIVMLSDSGHV